MFFNWFYRIVRKFTKPIAEPKAELWKRRLSFAYALLAWNAFGIIAYYIFTGRKSFAEYHGIQLEDQGTPAQQWTKTLKIKDATVYRIERFNVSRYEVHNDFDGETETKGKDTVELPNVMENSNAAT